MATEASFSPETGCVLERDVDVSLDPGPSGRHDMKAFMEVWVMQVFLCENRGFGSSVRRSSVPPKPSARFSRLPNSASLALWPVIGLLLLAGGFLPRRREDRGGRLSGLEDTRMVSGGSGDLQFLGGYCEPMTARDSDRFVGFSVSSVLVGMGGFLGLLKGRAIWCNWRELDGELGLKGAGPPGAIQEDVGDFGR